MVGTSDTDRAALAESRPKMNSRLFDGVDIAATALFAFEGAMAATLGGFDIVGAMVVGIIVGLGGGMIRDILLGDLPPAALRSPWRLTAAATAALGGFALLKFSPDFVPSLQYFDAAGLALFAFAGAQKAYEVGSSLLIITVMGTVTATGGGVIRDILLRNEPYVFSESVYATAAFIGAFVTGCILLATARPRVALVVGFSVTFVIRVLAIIFDWQLPHLGG